MADLIYLASRLSTKAKLEHSPFKLFFPNFVLLFQIPGGLFNESFEIFRFESVRVGMIDVIREEFVVFGNLAHFVDGAFLSGEFAQSAHFLAFEFVEFGADVMRHVFELMRDGASFDVVDRSVFQFLTEFFILFQNGHDFAQITIVF